MTTKTITVHFCEVCGDHATEECPEDDTVRQTFLVEAMKLDQCNHCKVVACMSCISDGACCEHAAELEDAKGRLF